MKSRITVTSTAGGTVLVPAGNYSRIVVQHLSGEDAFIDFVGGSAALTTTNGVKSEAGEIVVDFANSLNPATTAFASGIKAICASTEEAVFIVQTA